VKISLAEWKKIEGSLKQLELSFESTKSIILDLATKYKGEESILLLNLFSEIIEARRTIIGLQYQVHPQSEWLGGCSHDPKAHVLKEPNCVGYLKRRFTPEEVKEAGAECYGPCQWAFKTEGGK
jgi:hypothetical protein